MLLLFATLLAAAVPAPEWELIRDEDGIRTFSKDVEGTSIVAFRGEAEVDASIARLISVLRDVSREGEWTDGAKEARDIREIAKNESVSYNRTGTPWPLKDRDFVVHTAYAIDPTAKSVVIRMRSVEDPDAPERDCCVRGELRDSSYELRAVELGRRTWVAVSIFADPKGAVPKWIVNLFQKGWPRNTLEGLRRQVAKPDIVEHPDFVGIFENRLPVKAVLGP